MSDDAIPERWREAARAKLDRHWQAGTIDAADHEARTTAVRNATSVADLEAAVSGLPALPDPTAETDEPRRDEAGMLTLGDDGSPDDARGSGAGATAATPPSAPDPAAPASHDVEPQGSGGLFPLTPGQRRTVLMVLPMLAVLLFLVTRQWWWFLLIPIVGMLLGGGGPGHGDRDSRRGD